ncbi:MAG TPA: hypothetical protein HPP83_02545 [Candidatus Hydrogenedentes bacterium]|nr:hypothetical protein [Candidatus Hydrogenedentota bacterium]
MSKATETAKNKANAMRLKRFAIGFAAAAGIAAASLAPAEPELSFEALSTALGETAQLDLRIDGATEPFIGVNVKFSLPQGLSLLSVDPGELLTENFLIDYHRIEDEAGNLHTVVAYTITDSVDAEAGIVLSLAVQVSADPAEVGLDGADAVEAEAAILASGLAALDGETSMPHTSADGAVVIAGEPLPYLSVAPKTLTMPASAGSASLSVSNNGNADMAWTASVLGGATWLSIASGASGLNDGTIAVECQQNTQGDPRTETILVDAGDVPGSPAAIIVTQAGDTTPILSLALTEALVNAASGIIDVPIENVGNGVMEWTARVIAGLEWLTITDGAAGAQSGTLTIAYAPNISGIPRAGQVQVIAPNALESPGYVTITQSAPATLAVTPLERTVASAGGAVEFQVSTIGDPAATWSAQVSSGVDWLTIASGVGGMGPGTIVVTCAEHEGASARTGLLRIEAPALLGSPAQASVIQAGNATPLLTVFPSEQTVDASAQSAEFTVSNAGNGALQWAATLTEGHEWATIDSGAAGVDEGTIRLGFVKNAATEGRMAVMRVEAEGADGSPADVTLVQRGRDPLELTYPNGGERLSRGAAETITWIATDAGKAINSVSIILTKGGNVAQTIAVAVDNTGAHQWTVPADTDPGADYQIQIADVANPAVHDSSDDYFAVSCPPEAPGNVTATTSERWRIEVAWSEVDSAVEYELYRSRTTNVDDAQRVATIQTTTYNDWDVEGPRSAGPGCRITNQYNKYYYWVKAVNGCAESDFSDTAMGYCIGLVEQGAAARARVWERVLPAPSADGEEPAIGSDAVLAVRLRSEDDIDPESVWVEINGAPADPRTVQWIPVDEDPEHDGWAVYTPASLWTPGFTVTMTAGAATRAGQIVGPITHIFVIESEETYSLRSDESAHVLWQPSYSDFDEGDLSTAAGEANDLVKVLATDGATTPPLAVGLGPQYRLSPEQVFAVPQRVWLPVPPGQDPSALALYYYHSGGADAGWYPAEDVVGWLVPDSYLELEIGRTTYLGFVVRHGATVQLGLWKPDHAVPAAPAPASGDVLVMGVAAGLMIFASRKSMARVRRAHR